MIQRLPMKWQRYFEKELKGCTRKNLRKFFEVDKEHIVAFTLSALAKEQLIGSKDADKAIKKFKIDKNRDFPANL